jgi:hypothetical protein
VYRDAADDDISFTLLMVGQERKNLLVVKEREKKWAAKWNKNKREREGES